MKESDLITEKYQRYFTDPSGIPVLRRGAKGIACQNIRKAIELLTGRNIPYSGADLYDEALEAAVKEFQKSNNHRACDGEVGPGTRKLLTRLLLARFDPDIFARLQNPDQGQPLRIFISYARADSDKAEKVQQWLRDHGIAARRDKDWFTAGAPIPDNVATAIVESDKVIALYSIHSRDRDWPRFERVLAEQLEQGSGSNLLIYLKLDDTPLPQHDPHRLAVQAGGRTLKEFGNDLLRAIRGTKAEPPNYPYDENEIF